MSEEQRSIELEVDVVGTPEEVWRAIATGPGISSWYVPHVVEEREGGAATASFGPEPEMQIPGRVRVWEPLRRIVFDGGDADEGLAFEWLVEARDSGSCVVRLVNTGFATGEEWDDHYNGMTEGWKLFLSNLQLHLAHFGGQTATAMLPMASWAGPPAEAWARMLDRLGLSDELAAGDRIEVDGPDTPPLAGVVVEREARRMTVLVDAPAPGTAFIAAEGTGDQIMMSVWSYLYGDDGAAAVERDEPMWRNLLAGGATS
ncbi:MAG: SRPBCC domain-containing protein [Acidimicrobiales bacterium]